MKAFRIVLVIILSSAIVVSTCGALVFLMYLLFSTAFYEEYAIYLGVFAVVDVCAIILLAAILHMPTSAAVAVAVGCLLNLYYVFLLRWNLQKFTIALAGNVIVIMIAMTVGYVCVKGGRATPAVERKTFWSSLDPANKVAIITTLITAITGILGAVIGLLPKPH